MLCLLCFDVLHILRVTRFHVLIQLGSLAIDCTMLIIVHFVSDVFACPSGGSCIFIH